jgi:Tfp pilus assembly protein PilO
MDFKAMPLYAQLVIVLVVCLAMGGAAYWFVYQNQYLEIAKLDKKLAELQKEIQQGLIMEAQLPEFKKEVKKLEAKLQTLKRILPEQREVAELIQKVKNLADLTNLTILTIKADALRPVEFYAEFPYTFEVEGTYHNLAGFFDKISKFSRIINITGTNIKGLQKAGSKAAAAAKKKESQESTISSKFLATTFVFIEQKDDGSDGGAAAGRKGKGGAKKGGGGAKKKGGGDGGGLE